MCTKNELHIILKSMVKAYRNVYGKKLVTVLLYGSYARGDCERDSDIDIVAIVHGSRCLIKGRSGVNDAVYYDYTHPVLKRM